MTLPFESFFRAAPCFMTVQDRSLRIVAANDLYLTHFGEPEGRFCFEVYKHRCAQCLHCPVAQTFHDGASHCSEEVITTLSGEQVNTLVLTSPIPSEGSAVDLVMEMSTDITQIRSLQGQFTNLGMFVSSLSHGLKGMLTGLDGGIYLLKSGFKKQSADRTEEGLRMVQRNVEHIRRVVLDLLYMAGESEARFEAVLLRDLAEAMVPRLQKMADTRGIDFQVDLGGEGQACEVDVRSLQGSLANLIENAFESCRVDTETKDHFVRFRLYSDADNAIFEIEDNGIGMDREAREKMFSLSFSAKGKGTGLGLFTANKVIEKHRGVIEVKSEPGEGTFFRIRIPKVRGP